ncbi:HIT domain-containing protein [bacterium]|nr:MAG: HIT domain-containing protein [bacterium]
MAKKVNVNSAYNEEYREVLEKIEKSGQCPAPFCKDKGPNHKHKIEYKSEFWKVTRNTYNYQNAKFAFLIIPNRHVEDFLEILIAEWRELRRIIRYLVKKHDLKGYTFMWRMGETSHTGASVVHLHAHLICGYERPDKLEKEIPDSQIIKAVVGFGKE